MKNVENMKKASWRIFKKNGLVMNTMVAGFVTLAASSAFADNVLPTGGSVASGTVTIGAPVGNTMTIGQTSTYGITNWDSFSIGSVNTVNINNGSGYTMARVNGSEASMINGTLNATGTAYLINQNGVIVGNTGVVNTGGTFVASTRNISDSDFNSGTNTFNGTSANGVENHGTISAGGDAILVGKYVTNTGTVTAGKDALVGAGDQILLTDTGIGAGTRMHVAVGEGSIANSGSIEAVNAELRANGGNIYALAINNSGVVKARGLVSSAGRVVLSSANGDVQNSGTLQASSNSGNGAGLVDIYSAKNININNGSTIDTGKNGRFTANSAMAASAFTNPLNTGEQALAGNWKNGTGAVSFNGDVNLKSDGVIINSGKTATGARTDFGTNVKYASSASTHATTVLNGFNNVDLNNEGTNAKFDTAGSVIINAKNINFDEDFQVKGDFIANAAAFDDTTNDFVTASGANGTLISNSPYNSDGWKTNHGVITFTKTDGEEGTSPVNLDICCGVTLTSGLDKDGNRVSLLPDLTSFSYNNENNSYKWFEAKGFDTFQTTFEGGKLFADNNPTNDERINSDQNGFVTIISNNNIIDFNSESTNNTLIISNQDTTIGNNDGGVTVTAGKDLTVAVDEANPTSAGDGKLTVSGRSALEGQTIALFTSKQANNDIAGTLNGATFAEGEEFVNSSQEEWKVFYQNKDHGSKNPFIVYYKNSGSPFKGRPDCASNPSQSGCENYTADNEKGKEFRVALAQDNTSPEEGALAWGNSSQVRKNEFYTIKSYDYVDTKLNTQEKLSTFWYALPIQLVNIPLSGLSQVPGIQGIAEGLKSITGGIQGGLDSVVR